MTTPVHIGDAALYQGDCLAVLASLPDNSVDAIVTDPPYGLAFMGKRWDYAVPDGAIWAECLRVLKPGGHLLAFAGTRTQHRMAIRIEDAGFEIRDMIAWVYGSGFPKSLDVSKAIDKAAGKEREVIGPSRANIRAALKYGGNDPAHNHGRLGAVTHPPVTAPATPAARQWQGWGTALKPALEPITLARKPFPGTVAANVLAHGTGGINVDACRVGTDGGTKAVDHVRKPDGRLERWDEGYRGGRNAIEDIGKGRFPANLIHDGSAEVVGLFPDSVSNSAQRSRSPRADKTQYRIGGDYETVEYGDTGSAARFFYCAKASKDDRDDGCEGLEERESQSTRWSGEGMPLRQDGTERKMPINRNFHPTVKPTALMRYLCRLITPPGGVVLDPFMGSGSTGLGAWREGFRFIGIEHEAEYFTLAIHRLRAAQRQPDLFHEAGKAEARELEETK